MPDRLSLHAPVLVNTIGHCAGAIVFGVLLYLFIVDWQRDRSERSPLPCIAAALALLWNTGSLIGMATPSRGAAVADAIVAFSFSVLSLLPAVLLHISLRRGQTAIWIAGYAISGCAVALHMSDAATTAPRFHYAGILLVTTGFAALTLVSLARELTAGERDRSGARRAAAMALFLFAISFAHFETSHPATAWSGEAALHHAGIPLALFVLLQDYRFLLLDVFIRFMANAVMAALAVAVAYFGIGLLSLGGWQRDPFAIALAFVAACALLTVFGPIQARLQRWITRTVFLRKSVDQAVAALREAGRATGEQEYLDRAARVIASFLSATCAELKEHPAAEQMTAGIAGNASDPWRLPGWVRAIAPLHFASGGARVLLLGARAGGRRYLSEDVRALERLSAIICEHVERARALEMRNLMSQAELRALQAQINPHFLFNSLNTLYGTIGRENAAARGLVMNLASLFRYALSSDRTFIRLEEEMRIVRAYLEIEQLRLGPKLDAAIDVDEDALTTEIPVFSIQPLVENAIKHGVASREGSGFVRIAIRREGAEMKVEILNSGPFRAGVGKDGAGIGLANVRKRLALCYGPSCELAIDDGADQTRVSFSIPAREIAAAG